MNHLRAQAAKMRNEGYSYAMISEGLGIAKSTLSNWFKDKAFTPNQAVLKRIQYGPIKSGEKRHNQRVKEIEDLRQVGVKEIGVLSKRDLQLLGLGLYIGEGSKSQEIVRIINADPDVIRLAMIWFRKVCGLDKENITIALHLYPDNNIEESISFWKNVTGLSRENFRKTQIDLRKDKLAIKNKKLPYGTAHITIVSAGDPEKGVRLHRRLSGWISGVLARK